MTRVLVVDDEPSYGDALRVLLRREGFDDVVVATSGDEALSSVTVFAPDVVLLDVMLPGMSGLDVCREIRRTSSVPIIMLTARDGEVDKVLGLELGADDYVTKPYSASELVARMRAVLRRRNGSSNARRITVGRLDLDLDQHAATVDGVPTTLARKELELLTVLHAAGGALVDRDELIRRVWGADYVGDTRTLDVHIRRLREKVEPEASRPRHLITVRGFGYRLLSDVDAPR